MLSFLEAQHEEWTVTTLAKQVSLPRGTVSWVLKNLREQGKVFYRRVGKFNFYAASRQFSDDFNLLFKQHKPTQRYEIHGLTLRLHGDFANLLPLGGGDGRKVSVFRDGWGVAKQGLGETSFQLSGGTFMVWGSFSGAPLDFDRFLVWLARVDGFCLSRGWPRVEGNLGRWVVRQYGLNRDWKQFRNDSPTRCVSLKGFKMWFARVYEKEGLGVLREEIHSVEEKTLERFVGMFDGAMTNSQVLQLVATVATNLNSTQKTMADMVRRIGYLADKDEELGRLIGELKRSLDVRSKKMGFKNAFGKEVG